MAHSNTCQPRAAAVAPPVLESKFCSSVVQWSIRNQSSIDPNIPPGPYKAGHTFRLCLDSVGVRFSQKGYSVNPATQQPQFIWQIYNGSVVFALREDATQPGGYHCGFVPKSYSPDMPPFTCAAQIRRNSAQIF